MPTKPPPPPAEPYFGHDASKASLALLEELGIDDPAQCDRSLLLPANRELEPLRKIYNRITNSRLVLLLVFAFLALGLRALLTFVEEQSKPYEHIFIPSLAASFGVFAIYYAITAIYLNRRFSEHIRHAKSQWQSQSRQPNFTKIFPVYINHPWVYEHASGNCDQGLAIFDPINHRLTIHGLHYHYYIHQPDITALSYLSDWGLTRDVHLTVTMNDVPFEMVLSRYSPLADFPAAVMPYITTRRLIKLTSETLGKSGG